MKINLHKSETRGVANLGWLSSRHTYSFSKYYDANRLRFGKLRVINDDIVKPSKGFETHHHDNMEIISIPLRGDLRHKDSIGNEHIIESGEIQIMSAGKGIDHSEFNNSDEHDVNFLQIWVLPKKIGIEPRYQQKKYKIANRKNQMQLVVSPNGENGSIEINQDAYFSLITLEKNNIANYQLYNETNGIYIFVISGGVMIEDTEFEERDGAEISGVSKVKFISNSTAELLIIEVPIE